MTCASCGDHGIIRCEWSNAEPDFALCLCRSGQDMRRDENCGTPTAALWQVWCARNQIAPSRIFLMEEVLTPAELQQRGFSQPEQADNREAALLGAAKRQKGRL